MHTFRYDCTEFHSVERGAVVRLGWKRLVRRLSAQGKVLVGGLRGVLSENRMVCYLLAWRRRSLQFLQGTTTNEGAHQDLKGIRQSLRMLFKPSSTPFSRESTPLADILSLIRMSLSGTLEVAR